MNEIENKWPLDTTLSAKQLAQSDRRRERHTGICGALPEVSYEVEEHIAFPVRKKIFA